MRKSRVCGEAMTDTPTHNPPHNLEAEEAALGAFLLQPDTTLSIGDELGLRTTDFYRPGHRHIYDVIRYLHERGACDELAVVNELKARRKLKASGGPAYVLGLAERVPSISNARAYIDEVIDQAILRSMVETGHEIARLGYEHPDKIKRLVERATNAAEVMARNAHRVNGEVGSASALAEWTVEHVIGDKPKRKRWAYPLQRLQDATGGFGRGQLISIGAQPGVGKSAFKNQVLLALPADLRVGIINLEMDREDEQIRFVSNLTGIDSRKIWDVDALTDDEKLRVVEAAERLGQRGYEIHQGSKGIEAIRAVQRKHKYDVLMVDHFHIIDGVEEYTNNVRYARILKSIAVDESCAVINLFQLNKGDDPGAIPTVGRVKGGGAIHENSDHMFFLHRNHNDQGYPTLNGQIICAKMRGGTSGWQIPTKFNESRVAFEEV